VRPQSPCRATTDHDWLLANTSRSMGGGVLLSRYGHVSFLFCPMVVRWHHACGSTLQGVYRQVKQKTLAPRRFFFSAPIRRVILDLDWLICTSQCGGWIVCAFRRKPKHARPCREESGWERFYFPKSPSSSNSLSISLMSITVRRQRWVT
jgi:hypothetical protein